MATKAISSIHVEHRDSPRISSCINLDAWEVTKYDTEDALVEYMIDTLVSMWRWSNRKSIVIAAMSHKEMIDYCWSKRPTRITITYSDGTVSKRSIKYPGGKMNNYPFPPEGWTPPKKV